MSPSVSVRLLLTQSDARLVELARDGHERAFEALVQRYRRPLLAYCRRLLMRDERAEDALQQGLLQAWLALRDGCVVREAKPWLYRIVHNCALNALRASGYDYYTLSESLRGADAPEHDLDRRIAVRETLAGLATLPALQREALMRTALDGHSHEQVARALGLSEGALRGLVYRARMTLRTATTALTPSPVLSWALAPRTGTSVPLIARLVETGASGSSVGLGAALLKGGTVAVTAGALVGGIVVTTHHAVIHPPPGPSSRGPAPHMLLAQANSRPGSFSDASRYTFADGNGPATASSAHTHQGRRSPFAVLRAGERRTEQPNRHQFGATGPGDGVLPADAVGMTRDDSQDPSRPSGDPKDSEQQSSASIASKGSGSSKDGSGSSLSVSDGGGDKAAATTTSQSSGSGDGSSAGSGDGMSSAKDSSSSGSGSGDSQIQTSSETSTSRDSSSSSGGGSSDSTSSGSKDLESAASTSSASGDEGPSISW